MVQAPDLINELQAVYSGLSPGLQRAAPTIPDNPNIADAEAMLKETAYYWRDRNEQP